MEVPPNSPGPEGTSSLQRLASVPGDVELPRTFCCSPRPIGHVETRATTLHALPITTKPSIPSFLFPSFIPFAFFLPPHLLVPIKVSPSSPEVAWRAALAVVLWQEEGERTFSRSLAGSEAPVSIQGNISLLAGLCSAQQPAALAVTRPPLILWLSLPGFKVSLSAGNLTLPGCFQSDAPSLPRTDR